MTTLIFPKAIQSPISYAPSGKLTIHVDAAIQAPNIPLPIARVRKTGFTSSAVKRYADVLFANATPVANDLVCRTPTKGYLQRQITVLQADIDAWDATIQSKYEIYKGKEEAQEALLTLKEQMASAPDTLPGITPDYSITGALASFIAMPDDQTVSRIDIIQPTNQAAELTYLRDSFLGGDDVTGRKEDISHLVTLSQQDALALAEKTLADLESSDFSCVGSSTVTCDYGTKGAYVFYFTRQVNGAMETYTNARNFCSATTVAMDAGAVAPEDVYYWQYEQIHMLVDDDGVLSLSYTGPSEVTEILKDQEMELLSFSKIADIFEQNINRIDQPNATMTKDYYITDIVLGLMSVPEKDYETSLLTPVWDFMGYAKMGDFEVGLNRCEPFLTINAIDGSVIDRSLGY